MNYSVVIDSPDLAKLYRVDAMPMTLLIDGDGKIAASHVGMVDKVASEGEIAKSEQFESSGPSRLATEGPMLIYNFALSTP